jgi:hypothetical protein
MENIKLPVIAYNQRKSGYKANGRPRVILIDNIKNILSKHEYSAAMANHLAFESKLKLKPLRFTEVWIRTITLHLWQDNLSLSVFLSVSVSA